MKWAAVSVLMLSALCGPATAVRAEEDPFMAGAVASLHGFGEGFRAACFPQRPPGPLRIAVEEMDAQGKFSDEVARILTDRIETALETEFVIVPRRLMAELGVTLKNMGEKAPLGPDAPLDGIVSLAPDADARGQTVVSVFAWTTTNPQCKVSAPRPVYPGDVKEATDNPDAFFRRAVRKLDVRQVERLVIMEPDIGVGFGPGIARDLMVGQLQRQLMTAIRSAFEEQRRGRLSDAGIPPVGIYGDGTAVLGAWKAWLRLNREVTRGIDVHVVFQSPADPPRIVDVPGHFAATLLPENYEQVLLVKAAKSPFRVKEDPLDVEIEVKRPSRLFCFGLEANGEATPLYPTLPTLKDNLFNGGKKRFPKDFYERINLDAWKPKIPQDFFFHCIATKWRPSERLETQWVHKVGQSIDADTTRQLLMELRRSEGYAEAVTEIVSR